MSFNIIIDCWNHHIVQYIIRIHYYYYYYYYHYFDYFLSNNIHSS